MCRPAYIPLAGIDSAGARRALRSIIVEGPKHLHRPFTQPGMQTLQAGERALPGCRLLEQMDAGTRLFDQFICLQT